MKKLYGFSQNLMNGTVTMCSSICVCTTKELAEKVRKAVIDANQDVDFPCVCDEVKETIVYESEDEVPILNNIAYENESKMDLEDKG